MSGDGGTGNVRNVRRIAVRRCQECQEECQEVTGEETEMGVAHLLTGLTRFYTGRNPMDPLDGGTGKMEAAIAEGRLRAAGRANKGGEDPDVSTWSGQLYKSRFIRQDFSCTALHGRLRPVRRGPAVGFRTTVHGGAPRVA
jgi:hypothetical protein